MNKGTDGQMRGLDEFSKRDLEEGQHRVKTDKRSDARSSARPGGTQLVQGEGLLTSFLCPFSQRVSELVSQ